MAVGRRRNGGSVRRRHGLALRSLSPGHGHTVDGVLARWGHVIRVANLEGAVDAAVIREGVVSAADAIVNVVAKLGAVSIGGVAHLQAENAATDEVNPFDDLGIGRRTVLLGLVCGVEGIGIRAIGIGEDNSTKRVSLLISTVRIQFASLITGCEADLGLVNVTNDLNVILGIQPLHTSDSTSRDNTSAVTGLGAPSNFTGLTLANSVIRLGATPHTEIGDVVHERGLAERVGTFGGAVALVVAELGATNTALVASDLVGDVGVGEVFRGERFESAR